MSRHLLLEIEYEDYTGVDDEVLEGRMKALIEADNQGTVHDVTIRFTDEDEGPDIGDAIGAGY